MQWHKPLILDILAEWQSKHNEISAFRCAVSYTQGWLMLFGSKTLIFPAATLSSWKQKYMRELNAKATGVSLSSLSSKSVLMRSSVIGVRNRSWDIPTKKGNNHSCDQRNSRWHLQCQWKESSPSWVLTCFSVSPGLSTIHVHKFWRVVLLQIGLGHEHRDIFRFPG